MQWYHGTMAPWYHGTMLPCYHGTMAPWHHGTMAPWLHGSMVPWFHGSMAPCHHGVPWHHGTPWCLVPLGGTGQPLTGEPANHSRGNQPAAHGGTSRPEHFSNIAYHSQHLRGDQRTSTRGNPWQDLDWGTEKQSLLETVRTPSGKPGWGTKQKQMRNHIYLQRC